MMISIYPAKPDKRRYHITVTVEGKVVEFHDADHFLLHEIRIRANKGLLKLNRAKRTDRTLEKQHANR